MGQSRRHLLFVGAALSVVGAGLAACDNSTPVDNGTGPGAGGNNTSGGGDTTGGNTTGGGNSTGGNTTGGNTTGGNTTGGGSSGGNTTGGGTTPPPTPAGRVRYDVASPQGQAMLAIYARAVDLMMNLPDSDPRSWTFQWYSHWVKGPQTLAPKAAEISRVFGSSPSPARSLAQQMWSGCQAHGENQDESFFLPWHRMFVMAFENIVRAVANEPGFTLPYWNYLDPSQRAIPSQFRRPGDPVWGALYRPSRNAAVNGGGPIASSGDLQPDVLAENTYAPLGADQGFCANLDFGIHGTVHVGIGNSTTGMGAVPWAAGDPIFWLHHCNIDRLWASWNADGNANPGDSDFTSKPFVFAGPTGAQISYTVGQVLSLTQAGYSYDVLLGESGQPIPQQAALVMGPRTRRAPFRLPFTDVANAATTEGQQAMRPRPVLRALPTISHAAEGIRLGGGGAIRVRLTSTQVAPEMATRALATLVAPPPRSQRKAATVASASPAAKMFAFLAPKKAGAPVVGAAPPPAPPAPAPAVPAPKPGQKVFVVLSDLSTDLQPGVIYRVYLEAPRKGGAPEPFQIGTLSFFHAMGGGMGAMGGMKMAARSRSFDITALADSLEKQGRLEASPAVTFVPVGSPVAAAQPVIGSVSLAIQ